MTTTALHSPFSSTPGSLSPRLSPAQRTRKRLPPLLPDYKLVATAFRDTRYQKTCHRVDCEVVPSEKAHKDAIQDQCAFFLQRGDGLQWENFVNVSSTLCVKRERGHNTNNKRVALSVFVTHIVTYKNETVWRFRTKCVYDTLNGTSGERASCSFMKAKSILRVKISHKGRTSLGEGWNSTEIRNYDIFDVILKSGMAREQEIVA